MDLTAELLDLLVVFFDKIVIVADALELREPELIDKIVAYSAAGFVRTVAILPDYKRSLPNELQLTCDVSQIFDTIRPDFSLAYPLDYYLQLFGEVNTYQDMQRAPREFVNVFRKWVDQGTGNAEFELTRGNIYASIGDLLQSSPVFDSQLTEVRRIKYEHKINSLNTRMRALHAVSPWFHRMTSGLPRFLNPETIIRFREDHASDAFVNCVLRQCIAHKKSQVQAQNELEDFLDTRLQAIRTTTAKQNESQKLVLSGLYSTLGSLVGGTTGAFLGGVVGATVTVVADKFDKRIEEPWMSFFVAQ